MPASGIAEINQYLIGREADRLSAERTARIQDAIQRRQMTNDMMKMYMMTHSPAAGRLALAQQKQALKEAEGRAWIDYARKIPMSEIPPQMRLHYQALMTDPNPNPDLAEWLVKNTKGMAVQMKPQVTADPATGMPMITFTYFDPMATTVKAAPIVGPAAAPAAAPPAPPTLGATAPTAPAKPPTARGTLEIPSAAERELIDEYGGMR